MLRKLGIAAATLVVALATGPVFAQTLEAVDSTARGGVKSLIERIGTLEGRPTLGGLVCNDGQIAKYNGVAWVCAADDDTLGALDCGPGEIAKSDSTGWICVPDVDDVGVTLLRTIVVSPVGPTAAENCDELRNALAGIADNGATNPYLVRVEPGLYDCGPEPVAMKPFVDIEGSGQGTTVIRGSRRTLQGASNAELRFITVEASNPEPILLAATAGTSAIFFEDVSSFRLTHVTALAFAVSGSAAGISGIGGVTLDDVTAIGRSETGTGTGMEWGGPGTNEPGTAEWDDLTLEGHVSGDRQNMLDWYEGLAGGGDGYTLTIKASKLEGDVNVAEGNRLIIVASQFDGARNIAAGATLKCFGSFDGSLEPLGPGCESPSLPTPVP